MIKKELILQLKELWLVRIQTDWELSVINYTEKAQYEKAWEQYPELLKLRWYIVDNNYTFIAKWFDKFFNYEELSQEQIPLNKEYKVEQKVDGSLWILFYYNWEWRMATRGSLSSEQSIKWLEILKNKYSDFLLNADKNKTYLFEIIYPENKIVVDYWKEEKLILLSAFIWDKEIDIEDINFPDKRKIFEAKSFAELKALDRKNEEGFVIKFNNWFRFKIKFDNYIELHRIISSITPKTIYEELRLNGSAQKIKDVAPDELFEYVDWIEGGMKKEFEKIKAEAKNVFNKNYCEDRKEFALKVKDLDIASLLFTLHSNKEVDKLIWNFINYKDYE